MAGDIKAGEWIKMRVWLESDPKVIAIAARLAAEPNYVVWATGTAPENERDIGVTENVTECVVVARLLRLWGVVRRDGVREGDDLFIEHATLSSLDRISGVPCMGEAMASVGWAVPQPDGSVRFPKLLPHIVSPEEREREMARDRQRKKRGGAEAGRKKLSVTRGEKQRDMSRDMSRTCHADVTPREEKSREDKEETPLTPLANPATENTPEERPGRKRRSRADDLGQLSLVFPAGLNTPAFRAAFQGWLDYRQHKPGVAPLLPSSLQKQLDTLGPWGEEVAAAALVQSEANGWQGLFPEKVNLRAPGGANGQHRRPAAAGPSRDDIGEALRRAEQLAGMPAGTLEGRP